MPRPRHHASSRDAAAALARTAPLVSRWVERLLASHSPPLTVAQYVVLEAVGAGDVLGADLARRAAVSPAAVSQLLGGLETAGLLERGRAPGDRRRQPLELTRAGRACLGSARTLLSERLAGLLGDLRGPEADALAHLLGRLEAALGGAPPPRRPPRPPRPHPPPPPGRPA
ncbi:MAG TPA: MarR family winged helix-turn-helix transcriptional regulator [Gaiellaceae bacterium]